MDQALARPGLSLVEDSSISSAPRETFVLGVWVTEVVRGHGFGRSLALGILSPYLPQRRSVTARAVVRDKSKNGKILATFVIRQSVSGLSGIRMPRLFEELGKSIGEKVRDWAHQT